VPAAAGDARPSIWAAIHPRLLELIRAHRSTLIFVNSRRLAEGLAGALNEMAGETLVRAHHGSIARAQRVEVEELLKAGSLRALVATSSLELGIDMGAVDLVVQIEAPPSVASGLQRIGAPHPLDEVSEASSSVHDDLLAAPLSPGHGAGQVEPHCPRNPLDAGAAPAPPPHGSWAWTSSTPSCAGSPLRRTGRRFEGVRHAVGTLPVG
jgi:ATP-dependent Lhr-like helicase